MSRMQSTIGGALLIAWLCTQIGAEPPSPTTDRHVRQPEGMFVMQQVDAQNVSNRKLASPKWDGIVIRQRWSTLEPTSTTTNWDFLDQQIARAKRHGKKYILAIYTGNNAPRWLGVPLYRTAPYPWDATMLAVHGRMVAKLGRRFADDPDLVAVELGGPTRGPSGSLEMHLASGLTSQRDYSDARVIAAWKQCIDQYAAAFPHCALISDGGVAPGGRDATITQAVFDYLFTTYPDQANVSHCALKASTKDDALHHAVVVDMGRRGCRIGFEMVGPSVGGTNGERGPLARFGGQFSQALQIAERAGARWLKVYQADEKNLLD
jgi:hypothetical protein